MDDAIFADENCISLDKLYDPNHTALHFRFLCKNSVIESQLHDSVLRTWRELSELFHHLPVALDYNNVYNLALFPLNPQPRGHITEWETWNKEVVMQGSYLGVPEHFNGPTSPLSAGLFKQLYLEQFVFNLSLFITGPTEHVQDIESMVFNLLQNTDVEGVTLLSLEECQGVIAPTINVENVLPENSLRATSQPVRGFQRMPCKTTSLPALGWDGEYGHLTRSFWFEDAMQLPVSVITPENNSIAVGSEIHANNATVTLQNVFGIREEGTYGDTPFLLGCSTEDGFDYPLWLVGNGENGMTYLNRIVDIPELRRVEDAFYATRAFPSATKFDMRGGSEYQIMFIMSDNDILSELISSGLTIERDILADGKVSFTISMLNDNICAPLFAGNEALAETYLEKLSQEDSDELTLEHMLSLSEEIGGNITEQTPQITKQ